MQPINQTNYDLNSELLVRYSNHDMNNEPFGHTHRDTHTHEKKITGTRKKERTSSKGNCFKCRICIMGLLNRCPIFQWLLYLINNIISTIWRISCNVSNGPDGLLLDVLTGRGQKLKKELNFKTQKKRSNYGKWKSSKTFLNRTLKSSVLGFKLYFQSDFNLKMLFFIWWHLVAFIFM